MKRELSRLRQAAQLITQDLNRTTRGSWSCTIDDDYVMTLSEGRRRQRARIGWRVRKNLWPPDIWLGKYREVTLEDEATEAVSGQIGRALRAWNVDWPTCPEHNGLLGACGMVWVCGTGTHDLGLVGELPAEAVRPIGHWWGASRLPGQIARSLKRLSDFLSRHGL